MAFIAQGMPRWGPAAKPSSAMAGQAVYDPVTHGLSAMFPGWVLAPAFGLDLHWQRRRPWRQR